MWIFPFSNRQHLSHSSPCPNSSHRLHIRLVITWDPVSTGRGIWQGGRSQGNPLSEQHCRQGPAFSWGAQAGRSLPRPCPWDRGLPMVQPSQSGSGKGWHVGRGGSGTPQPHPSCAAEGSQYSQTHPITCWGRDAVRLGTACGMKHLSLTLTLW